jgi:hypothetical protein
MIVANNTEATMNLNDIGRIVMTVEPQHKPGKLREIKIEVFDANGSLIYPCRAWSSARQIGTATLLELLQQLVKAYQSDTTEASSARAEGNFPLYDSQNRILKP